MLLKTIAGALALVLSTAAFATEPAPPAPQQQCECCARMREAGRDCDCCAETPPAEPQSGQGEHGGHEGHDMGGTPPE